MLIYLITNRLNGKRYVGQTSGSVRRRFIDHAAANKPYMPINAAMRKYGRENFTIETLCACETTEELNRMEVHFAESLDTFVPNGYNLRAGGRAGKISALTASRIAASMTGKVHSMESRQKRRLTLLGKRDTPEYQALIKPRTVEPQPKRPRRKSPNRKNRGVHRDGVPYSYTLVGPDGQIQTVTNMYEFSIQNDLNSSHLSRVVRGLDPQHKGWRLAT
jgi:group I intron endonuclease